MAPPNDSSVTPQLPGLTIDDLLEPLPETFRLGGPGPFVINLCSSSVSMSVPAGIAGCRQGRVYQIQRREEDLVRFRLRLGPFATENDADALLPQVREAYPGALTATASADDLRALDLLGVEVAPMQAKPAPSAAAPVSLPPAREPVVGLSIAPAPPPRSAAAPAVPPMLTALTLQAEPPRHAASRPLAAPHPYAAPGSHAAPAPRSGPQSHAARPSHPAARPLSAAPSPSAMPAHPAAPSISAVPAHPAVPSSRAAPPPRSPPPPPQAASSVKRSETVQSLENTQTLRALTTSEIESEVALRWYVIQLSLSEQPVDPHTVPILDIFSLYRLYSVSGLQDGRVMHALRLGFFGEQIAASAVANYLTEHYDNPVITRVSVAERERFANQGVEALKDIGATGTHKAIEITGDRIVRQRKTGA